MGEENGGLIARQQAPRSLLENAIHDDGPLLKDWPYLLSVDQLRHGRTAVPDQARISSRGVPLSESRDTKLCRSSLGVHSSGFRLVFFPLLNQHVHTPLGERKSPARLAVTRRRSAPRYITAASWASRIRSGNSCPSVVRWSGEECRARHAAHSRPRRWSSGCTVPSSAGAPYGRRTGPSRRDG